MLFHKWIIKCLGIRRAFQGENRAVSDTYLIVGLGNPGKEYENTRHNVGFEVVDALAAGFGEKVSQKKFSAMFAQVMDQDRKLLLLKPMQYMNRSGQATATAAGFYRIEPDRILVVLDDTALEPGRIRIRPEGSAGGHNGLADVIQKMGTSKIARLRIGIGQSPWADKKDYVLGRFTAEQREEIAPALRRAVNAILCWTRDGMDRAMSLYNADPSEEKSDIE